MNYHRTGPDGFSCEQKPSKSLRAGPQVSSLHMRCRTTPDSQHYREPRLSYFQPVYRSLVAFFHSGIHSALNNARSARAQLSVRHIRNSLLSVHLSMRFTFISFTHFLIRRPCMKTFLVIIMVLYTFKKQYLNLHQQSKCYSV